MALVTGIGEYQVRVVSGMIAALEPLHIPLLVVANEPFASDRTSSLVLDLIRRRIPRGVIALADASQFPQHELPDALLEAGMPTVTLGKRLAHLPRLIGDNAGGMRALLEHLLDECGVRLPVLVRGIRGHIDSESREATFRAELARRGLPVDDELIIDGEFRPNESYDALHRLLGRRQDFDAVVALNDMSAFGALSALTDHGLRVPQDMLLTGFDNTEGSVFTWPPLTTVDQNLEDQGARAVDLLLRSVGGEVFADDVVVPSRLVVRVSTTRGGAEADPEAHAATMRALQTQVALQDAAAYLSSSLANCRTVPDVITALEPRLSRLGINRCFLSVDSPTSTLTGPAPACENPSRLVLSYRNGVAETPTAEIFSRHELLSSDLRPELNGGVLLLQALSIAGRERGHLLYEPVQHSYLLTEAMRVELPRSIDIVLSWQEMQDHAATLERLVTQRTRELELANAELKRSVMRDGLTSIANRLAFQQYLDEISSSGGDLSILMIDVDQFKAYNDHYGHPAGDEALRAVASCLMQAVREPRDLACRYGGEEFAVILRDSHIAGALSVARRFQRILTETAIPHLASTVAPVITVSMGAASGRLSHLVDVADVIAAADQALYHAKSLGRNRIAVARAGIHVRHQAMG